MERMQLRLNEDEIREYIAEALQRRGFLCGEGDVFLRAERDDDLEEIEVAIEANVEVQIAEKGGE
jgi:hypothetical protein